MKKENCLTFSIQEAGAVLGLGRDASYAAVANGDIPVIRLGKRLRVPKAAIERMIEAACNAKPGAAA